MATVETTIGEFLCRRLYEAGLKDIFGVPGDFVLGWFNQVLKSKINYVGTCNELNAAYAADAYARINGIGAVATTYAVGELSAINGVAGSWAENVPVVKIAGVPATTFYQNQPLLHHTLGDYQIPYKMYKEITCAHTILRNAESACAEIDRVLLACLTRKLPVYIGIPSDMVQTVTQAPADCFKMPEPEKSDPDALDEAILETLKLLHSSRRPMLIPGVEVARYGLKEEVLKLINKSGLPFATMMLGKSMIDEEHPQFIGLYCGNRSRVSVQQRVEDSDCLIMIGEKLTDFNTGGFSAVIDKRCTVEIHQNCVRISFHIYQQVYLNDFVRELTARISSRSMKIVPATEGCVHRRTMAYIPDLEKPLTMSRLFDAVSHLIQDDSIVIAETGASLFSAAEVMMPKNTVFIGQTFYGSIGYTVGATLGACIAAPKRKVYLFVGDGSFQVTCQDLSTMIRYGCKPVIFLVNNDGYTIERVIVDRSYNDIQPWKYHMLPQVFGGGKSFCARTEGELEVALTETSKLENELSFIEVFLDRWDCNDALRRAGATMALNNRLLEETETPAARRMTSFNLGSDENKPVNGKSVEDQAVAA